MDEPRLRLVRRFDRSIRPACEYAIHPDRLRDTAPYLWSVMGTGRPVIGGFGGWPVVSSYVKPDGSTGLYYGGTISDGSVIRAIQHLRGLGYKVLFYPFLMMDIPPPDPSPFPWRGRIGGAAADIASFFEREDGYLRFVATAFRSPRARAASTASPSAGDGRAQPHP